MPNDQNFPITLAEAVLTLLRQSIVAPICGDTFNIATESGSEIDLGFDYLPPTTTTPYVRVVEPGETRTYFTGTGVYPRPFLAQGTLSVECYAQDRSVAYNLANQVAFTLHDAPMTWLSSPYVDRVMHWRCVGNNFIPMPDIGLATPTIFQDVVTFEYMYQGGI